MDFSEGSDCRSVRTSTIINCSGGNSSFTKSRKKKRFSDEQIRLLEVMFGSESKPEPKFKQQLAAELGLQPKQVSIWFQNRRARLKPKQIEREYDNLKASHDALACKFDSLKKDNLSLTAQLRTLMEKYERVRMERNCRMSSEPANESETMEQACIKENTHMAGDQHHLSNNKDHNFKPIEQQLSFGSGYNIQREMMYSSPFASLSGNTWSSEYAIFMDQPSCGNSQLWDLW